MSRTPTSFSLPIVRGTTWEDSFDYTDSAGVAIDLTGYEARMQVRTVATLRHHHGIHPDARTVHRGP